MKKKEIDTTEGDGDVAMPGLHLHRGMGRGERRSGPDIVSVKTVYRRSD